MQAKYATDILFRRQDRFQPLYDAMTRTAVHSIKAVQVATYLGRKLTKAYSGEAGNDISTRGSTAHASAIARDPLQSSSTTSSASSTTAVPAFSTDAHRMPRKFSILWFVMCAGLLLPVSAYKFGRADLWCY